MEKQKKNQKKATGEKQPRDRKTKGLYIRRLKEFFLSMPAGAEVYLAGSFNDWNETAKPMKWSEERQGYAVRAYLLPGEYEYKFIVNGNWITDPANPENRANEYNSFNSVIVVK